MKPQAALLWLLVVVVATFSGSCSSGFGGVRASHRLVVEIDPAVNAGSLEAPLDLAVDTPIPFRVTIRALLPDGTQDASFNRFVRISSKPGAVEPLVGPGTDGRNVALTGGESATVEVRIANAYGRTFIVADDLGYIPADPLRDPPPACSNGIDDDGDGKVDYPADEGCAFANDDAEEGGSYAEGASRPIFFKLPRIADVRGLRCDAKGCSGNGRTPYPKEQILLDTGYRDDPNLPPFVHNTVVVRISSDGFYATDLDDKRGGFNSIFAFNFNAPPRMRVCDRLKTYGGTANEFFGFTQMSYPTWTLEEWDPSRRLCMVPEPELLSPGVIIDTSNLLRLSGNLVRVQTLPDRSSIAKVTPKFGPGDAPRGAGGLFAPTEDATNCDLDKNGRIEFVAGNPENDCAQACSNDPECTEWSNYAARSTFRITVTDSNGQSKAIQADATASASFDPVAMKGKEIRAFSGTLHYFSGGSQFTIEARCKDDIIIDLASAPFPSDTRTDLKQPPPPLACVFPRTFLENNPQ
ncbi:MAG: hypothetical protein KF819_32265 [Labilithrix sp.]|nr:hypothetical protein [Labilithrix sp.]